ncbi:MAG: LPS export ABC transporter permease LptG [Piscirickettsiaceae bacterium CG_4_9_14_3_um_filter_43_564]|nr:LPS export ABC transporter permease LptG [Thiomicrospira sp.]OIP93953.1 MAG: LPS export ABC transporter permease LptG [Thiomicrospira sp. CG2_30_44_34]PIQ03020.1 MAG: LPS export ABC transporter permease LptG [Piscirickettsiaceae bacterium CG18_big_fil_WC_8_21_14_2_50_44_103]PIU38662.1 MAG: LPS export ABC transporter permease LptG [Piscirickettsiaceae bacterium CG07_land_8_20_14_0_80_44_28]PIW57072.1 MAG: LPS export ABC transporter permease LptG [Piscirickettsiaceae bacterium CG12_big_fil_rev
MNLIERYLGRVLVSHTLLVLMVLLIILGFSEFMIQVGKLTDEYTLNKGVLYTVLKLPVFAYEIFPVAILIGTLIGLGGLANHAELTVLRVTGWSIRRIFIGVMKSAMLMWLIVAIMGEWIAPVSEGFAKKMRSEALHQNFSIGASEDFWMRDGEKVIHVGQVITDSQFYDISIYRVQAGALSEYWRAKTARFSKKDQQWRLYDVVHKQLNWTAIETPKAPINQLLDFRETLSASMPVELPVTPTLISTLNVETRYMGVIDLWLYIQFLEANALDAEPYKLAFWRKVIMPLMIVGMISLVFPLIFGSQRQVSIGQRIFVGIIIGMSFNLLNQIFGNLSVVYQFPAILGAFLPSLVLLLVAWWLLKRLR